MDLNRAYQTFLHAPAALRGAAADAAWLGMSARLRATPTPRRLVFFVTHRCDRLCQHCFFAESLNGAPDELSVDEVARVARGLRVPLDQLNLTGGEPFLRRDIVEVCAAFDRENGTRRFSFSTGGRQPERVEAAVREVLRRTGASVRVNCALDGERDAHTRLRQIDASGRPRPHLDDHGAALETARRLAAIAADEPRLEVAFLATVSSANFDSVRRLLASPPPHAPVVINLFRDRSTVFGVPAWARAPFAHPNGDLAVLTDAQIGELTELVARDGTFASRVAAQKLRMSREVLREGRRPAPCRAGVFDGVLYANGDVALCEMSVPVGNVRDAGGDFAAVWSGPEAGRMREALAGCACIMSCNLKSAMVHDRRSLRVLAGADETR